ncbi:FAD-dependent oxidoreductase [Paenarthrobacter sp. NPDC089989]|uniref:FAD-dependent oxidoreductase n=1 Tax=unclassified Paenarthrobacter TaxID=2634190 RepID=UPI00381A924B
MNTRQEQRVAVVGAGVSGLTAAHLLARMYDVTVFEAKSRLGGNADTRSEVTPFPIDLGFVGFNEVSYPNLVRLFSELGIESNPAVQSTDAVCGTCQFKHLDGDTLGIGGLPTKPQDVRDEDWRNFAADMSRFGRELGELPSEPDLARTTGQFLRENDYSRYFTHHFLYPRIGPWFLLSSRDLDRMPIQFLRDSLEPLSRPDVQGSWKTIKGGSQSYVSLLAKTLSDVRLATPVRSIRRVSEGVEILDATGTTHSFGKVVIAVNPLEALRMLDNPSDEERSFLGAFEFTKVEVVLHTDESVLPGKDCHGGLMIRLACAAETSPFGNCHVDVTKALHLETDVRYLKTFNPIDPINPSKVLVREVYEVPLFTPESIEAQYRVRDLSDAVLAYAGAYLGNGFHEAGCSSGAQAAKQLGVEWT